MSKERSKDTHRTRKTKNKHVHAERKKERQKDRKKAGKERKEKTRKERIYSILASIGVCVQPHPSFPNAMEGRRGALIFVLDYGLRPYIA